MEHLVASLGLLASFIDVLTGVVVGVGVIAAALDARKLRPRHHLGLDDVMSGIRLSLGRWLALALELALAADILRSIVAPTWDEIGKLAAIAALRTVLNYFLEKEIAHGGSKLAPHVA